MKKRGVQIVSYVGIDPLAEREDVREDAEVRIIKEKLGNEISLSDGYVDCVVGFAVLEHVNNPGELISESLRVLKPGGRAIFTCPAVRAKPLLEFLAWRLGWVSGREIAEHKRYFNKKELRALARVSGAVVRIRHRYFELGLNNLLVLVKV